VEGKSALKVLDISDTAAGGPLPGCILAVSRQGLVCGWPCRLRSVNRVCLQQGSDAPPLKHLPTASKTTQVQTLEEFYLTRTRLTGEIPDTVAPNSQLRIVYSWNLDPNTYKPWGWAFSGVWWGVWWSERWW
jgi:hypothetical protein